MKQVFSTWINDIGRILIFFFSLGGFMCPFVIFGIMQMLLAICAFCLMTSPEQVKNICS